MQSRTSTTFVPIRRAAASLGVPIAWLRREAESGNVPAIRAGARWLVNIEKARDTLDRRTVAEGGRA